MFSECADVNVMYPEKSLEATAFDLYTSFSFNHGRGMETVCASLYLIGQKKEERRKNDIEFCF